MPRLAFDDLSAANLARVSEWHPDGLHGWSPSDWAVAATGELGELCSAIRRMNDRRDGVPGSRELNPDYVLMNAAEELGDTVVFLDLLAQRLGLNLGDCVTNTFNRVSAREGFRYRLCQKKDSST